MASFRKRGNKWEYRIRYTVDGKQREKSKGGFRTKTEAKAEADKVEYQMSLNVDRLKGDMLFTDYYRSWVYAHKIGVHSLETDNFYKHAIKLVDEYFSGVLLKDITRSSYQSFINDYAKTRSKETVRKAHAKVGPALREAHADGIIIRNPAYKPTLRGIESRETKSKYLEEDEATKLTAALLDGIRPSYTTRYMLLLQLATGMRVSEVMAIQFNDVDFLHNRIDINKSWDYKFNNDFKETKNKDSRNIYVDQQAMDTLKDLYNYQASKKVKDSKQRIFLTKYNEIPSPVAINKTLKRACERAGIPVITSHGLRHTHASMLILEGADLSYVAKRLGHRDSSITAKVYVHVLKQLEEKNVEQITGLFGDMYN